MKKIALRLLTLFIVCSLVLGGCATTSVVFSYIEDKSQASVETVSTEAYGVVKKEKKQVCSIMYDLDDVTEKCLEATDEHNSLGYLLDEEFYLWYYKNYGETSYRNLMNALLQGANSSIYSTLTGKSLHVLWSMYCAYTGLHPEALEHVYWKPSERSSDIVIDLVGDINFHETWGNMKYLKESGKNITACFSEELVEELASADLFMVNNEFTYGVGGQPLEGKAYIFQANPSRVSYLKELGVDVVSLANNHVCDYGEEGLRTTLNTLEQVKMPYVGAGTNIDEASQITYFIINGKKIAITAATQIERTYHYTKEATENSPGVLKTLNPDKYVEVIKKAKKTADYVIAYVHWGTEGKQQYEYDQRLLARAFVEAGADVIIGNHTHCLQGIEYIEDVPVFYSLGNFWFEWPVENSKNTGVAQVIIHEDLSSEYRFLPCKYGNYITTLNMDHHRQEAYENLESLSEGISIDADGYIRKQ